MFIEISVILTILKEYFIAFVYAKVVLKIEERNLGRTFRGGIKMPRVLNMVLFSREIHHCHLA